MTHPRQTIASWLPLSASASAVTGSSNEPGTQKTSGSLTPCSSRASSAPRSRRLVTSSLKRDTTTAIRRSPPVRSGLAPFSPTDQPCLEKVPELVFLRLEVSRVVGVGRDADRYALHHLESEALQAVDLLRVVGEQPDLADPEVVQELAADPVIPLVGRVTQSLVCLDCVQPVILPVGGVKLVGQA